MAKKKSKNQQSIDNPSTEQTSDPDVAKELADLMLEFDNAGVAIDESQWQELKPDEMNVSTRWLNDTKAGKTRPVPPCLHQFASKELMDKITEYQKQQEESRKLIMHCKFGKFSLQKKTEDGKQKMSLPIQVPEDDLRPSTAHYLFARKTVKIAVSRRAIGDWGQQSLPGIPDAKRIYECNSEIVSYGWAGGKWKFAFLIPTDILSIDEANEIWTCSGSCRIEVTGEAIGDDESEDDSEGESDAKKSKATDPPGQKTLGMPFDKAYDGKDKPRPKLDDLGQFEDYLEYPMTFKTNGCIGVLRVAVHDGKCFASATVQYKEINTQGTVTINEVFGLGIPEPGDRYFSSVQNALAGVLGTLIDEVLENPVIKTTTLVDDLRDARKKIEAGEIPEGTPNKKHG